MMKICNLIIMLLISLSTISANAQIPQLDYRDGYPAPNIIPFPDSQLPTITAQLWKTVTEDPTVLEGPAFDESGNLYLTDIFHGKVLKIDKDKKISTVVKFDGYAPSSTLVARDGRLFVAINSYDGKEGKIISMNPDGSDTIIHVDADKGYHPNDMVLDKNEGLYFTDARGDSGNPIGGVYYLSPDHKTVTQILGHLTGGNGIALSPDGGTLWVVEFSAGLLHRLVLQDATHIQPYGETVAYRFNSPAPDSMKADSDGNLYIALHGQGRVIVLNSNAAAIGQITIPEREKGKYLRTTNIAFRPQTNEIYILSSNDPELHYGSAVFIAGGFAKAQEKKH